VLSVLEDNEDDDDRNEDGAADFLVIYAT